MDRSVLIVQVVLIYYGSDGAMMCLNGSACCDYGDIIDTMVVNTFYINCFLGVVNNTFVFSTNNTAICSPFGEANVLARRNLCTDV